MRIGAGFPAAARAEIAAMYWDAFGSKLGRIMGPQDRALAYIARNLRPDHAICAYDDAGHLLGVIGFKTHRGALVDGGFSDLCRVYGWTGAVLRSALLGALIHDTDNDRFLIDGIFVSPAARGNGIGTALLDAVAVEARRRGYRQLRLDVIDTNPLAKALYLRQGFVVLHTHRIGIWRYLLGFTTSTTMVRDT